MSAIYISYRSDDAPGAAARLHKTLSEAFGHGSVCMDVARSQPKRDARQVVNEQLDATAVMLVVIGPTWSLAQDPSGRRALDNPQDAVGIEIGSALRRAIPVIPVLVQGAGMVQRDELPAELANLVLRTPVTLRASGWDADVQALVATLKDQAAGRIGSADAARVGAAATPARTAGARAATGTGARGARPAAGSTGEGLRTLWAALAVVGANAAIGFGLYTYMGARNAELDRTVAEARQAADTALARAAAAKAEADAARDQLQTATPAVTPATPSAAPQATTPAAPPAANPAAAQLEAPAPPKSANNVLPPAQTREPARTALASAPAFAPASPPATPPAPTLSTPTAGTAAVPAPSATPSTPVMEAPPGLPPLASRTARVLNFSRWTLRSNGCGSGPVSASGVSRVTIDRTAEGIVVTEEFSGSGSGYTVAVSGRAVFSQEQTSYEIPTQGQWSGPRSFRTVGTDRVSSSDGLTPTRASVVSFQTLCG